MSPPEIPPPKTKNVPFNFDYKIVESVDGLDSSPATGLQSSARFGTFARLKGLSWADRDDSLYGDILI